MSEYQYYEFQALNRPLTPEAQGEMRKLSSRVQLTATSASFVYNYGNFRGDPYRVLATYFDVMLYITNWGTRQLMFRFPVQAIPDGVQRAYQYANSVEWISKGEYVLLNVELNQEADYDGWVEGEGLLPGIALVHHDILRGDYRALYLAWLMIAAYERELLEEDEDLTEPPVPPNLQDLSPSLQSYIDFFGIDADLVAAAAQASPSTGKLDEKLSASLDLLPEAETRDFLERLLNGETYLDVVLANRLRELAGTHQAEPPASERRADTRRGLRQLFAAAEALRQQRLEVARRKAEAARLEKLQKTASQQDRLWAQLPDLIAERNGNAYDEAVRILKDLHALAAHEQHMAEFEARLTAIRSQYPTLRGLHSRLKAAGLG